MPTLSPQLQPAKPVVTSTIQIDGQTESTWNAIVAGFADANVYQTWAYGSIRWGASSLSHLVLRRDGKVIAAAQVRIARVPVAKAGIAYLRWGPMCHPVDEIFDPSVVAEMLRNLRQEYVERRGLALQVLPSAYATQPRAQAYLDAFAGAGLTPDVALGQHRSVVVDLSPDAEAIRKGLDKKWRNQLNGAQKNPLTIESSDTAAAYAEFIRIYDSMLQRKQFETSVDVHEFGRIHEALPPGARLQTFLAKAEGEVVGAVVCSVHGDSAIYLLGATNEKARTLKAAYLLHWEVMMYLKTRGVIWYDLGGIDPETNPGGYHFKSGFGGADLNQVPPHVLSAGMFADVVLRGATLLRRWRSRGTRKAPSN